MEAINITKVTDNELKPRDDSLEKAASLSPNLTMPDTV
jgi:hypothetical protein